MSTVPPECLEIVRCPRCRERLAPAESGVQCVRCGAVYPVADGIPVLLTELDEVGRQMREWYDRNWQGSVGDTSAKRAHEDVSDLGQRYIQVGERRWITELAAREGGYFVDIGCGAQPRVEAGRGHGRHVCVDLSLAGLQHCRELLGDRGLYICGSIVDLPLPERFASTALMAHSLYHVHRDQQPRALRNAHDVLAAGGELVVFYSNPRSLELSAIIPLRLFKRRRSGFYFAPLRIGEMLSHIAALQADGGEVASMRAVTKMVSQPLLRLFGGAAFRALRLLDRLPPSLSTYVAYRVRRT